ncbi:MULTISPECIES: Ppx/GppA phosphatase family protein [unclassified Nitratiruptor]|uniref:Ppx/GppA phosphatase family protein n=1 Tax=unclassified Nitratiruptor TaxID=2624044 RepID=UPI001915090A|nr:MULTISPECIES: Ppx/GppA phosphatase family protein [unclassified Nitratiruptor]BCD59746.1 exopolyphosphatase / guanosine-5'-triphosphate,3'-diphosphate pyrophosphatase [Nitratiruptor sp. YY08-10]BCD63670.1 exopolyphosphatase / guanosine-5'-triphosphate,3'-diphosphate pyrophosphatase [Nitratiruptor sp. YY08-14]
MARRTAIIDIGSNSARMIVIERTSRFGFYLLNETKSKVRIGEGAYEHGGLLQEVPMQRALNALHEFLHIAQSFKVRKILCVATSALRDAPNRSHFLSVVRRELGLNIKVIDGKTEALLGGIAAANLLPILHGITIDIGGGSTELALIQNRKVVDTVSLDLGTVRLKELFFDKKENLEKAIKFIHNELQKIPEHFKNETAIGIGGTIRALSRAIMEKNEYPLDKLHAFTYALEDEKRFIDKIITAPVYKLKKLHIKKERYDTIKEGALIFKEVLSHIRAKRVITSGVGVREGVFLKDLLRNQHYRFPTNFEPSVRSLLDRFCINEKQNRCLFRFTKRIYDALHPLYDPDKKYEKILLIASKLTNIGIKIDFYDHHKHSSYIILNDLEYNLTHQEIATISTLVRFHKKKLPSKSHLKALGALLPPTDTINWLSFTLTLAEVLNKDLSCPDFSVEYSEGVILIKSAAKLYLAKEEIKSVEKPAPVAVLFRT